VAKAGTPTLKVSTTRRSPTSTPGGRTETQFALAAGQFASVASSGSASFDVNNDGTVDNPVTFATCPPAHSSSRAGPTRTP
jgi:hypothetical protein